MNKRGIGVILVAVVLLLSSCSAKTIKIGFVGDMTSKNSQLAVDIRNAVEYGMNQVNKEGGVKGHPLELVIKDDGNDIEQGVKAHEEFKEEGVQFVVGHITSNMADAVIQSEGDDLLFFSPTMSTDTLTGIDDYFVRTSPINSNQAITISQYFEHVGIKEIAVVYDMMNAEYTENLYMRIDEISGEYGFEVAYAQPFDTRVDDLQDIGNKILEADVKNVLFISQATDTAFFMQYLKQRDDAYVGTSVSWSMTQDLAQNGGKNVQGMMFVGVYEPEMHSEQYNAFAADYESVYGYKPSFASILGYDSIMALAEGLEASDSFTPVDVRAAILDIKDFQGLQEVFDINEYGDNNRQYLMYKLVDDAFIPQWD